MDGAYLLGGAVTARTTVLMPLMKRSKIVHQETAAQTLSPVEMVDAFLSPGDVTGSKTARMGKMRLTARLSGVRPISLHAKMVTA